MKWKENDGHNKHNWTQFLWCKKIKWKKKNFFDQNWITYWNDFISHWGKHNNDHRSNDKGTIIGKILSLHCQKWQLFFSVWSEGRQHIPEAISKIMWTDIILLVVLQKRINVILNFTKEKPISMEKIWCV